MLSLMDDTPKHKSDKLPRPFEGNKKTYSPFGPFPEESKLTSSSAMRTPSRRGQEEKEAAAAKQGAGRRRAEQGHHHGRAEAEQKKAQPFLKSHKGMGGLTSSLQKPRVKVQPKPPSAHVYRARKVEPTAFRKFYERGDLPIKIGHVFGIDNMNSVTWSVDIQKLDFHHYLPIFFDGIREEVRVVCVCGGGGSRAVECGVPDPSSAGHWDAPPPCARARSKAMPTRAPGKHFSSAHARARSLSLPLPPSLASAVPPTPSVRPPFAHHRSPSPPSSFPLRFPFVSFPSIGSRRAPQPTTHQHTHFVHTPHTPFRRNRTAHSPSRVPRT